MVRPLVAPEDLILSKLVWMKQSQSELQARDVRQLLAHVKTLEMDYLGKWSRALGVYDLLEQAKTCE